MQNPPPSVIVKLTADQSLAGLRNTLANKPESNFTDTSHKEVMRTDYWMNLAFSATIVHRQGRSGLGGDA